MNTVPIPHFIQLFQLLRHCDNKKVYYRSRGNTLAEEMFSSFEMKIGIMVDYISVCLMEDLKYGNQTTQTYSDPSKNISLTDVKINEIQTLVFTHYVSLVESFLRKKIVLKTGKNEKILLNDILLYLHKRKKINNQQLHLWTGIRQLRNAIVHYDSKASVDMVLKYEEGLVVTLKKDKPTSTYDLYLDFKLMRWITYNVEPLISQK